VKRLLPLLLGALPGAFWGAPATALAQEDRPVLFHTPARQVPASEPVTIEGLLIDGKRVEKVVLRFRTTGEPYRTQEMEVQYGDVYRAVIPGKSVQPPNLEYYVQGATFDGKSVPLYQSERKPTKVRVISDAPKAETPAPAPLNPPPPPVAENPPPPPAPNAGVAAAEPRPPPPTEEPPPPSPPPPRKPPPAGKSAKSELEEDLALYSAEDRGAVMLREEVAARQGPDLRTAIGRDQIRSSGARTVADVLDLLPGLTVSRDIAGFYRAGVRGVRSDPEVLVLLNGQPLNDPYDGRALLELPAFNLDRVELSRGPGAGGFIATVSLFTDPRDGVRGTVTGGMATTIDGHASGAWSVGVFRVSGDLDIGLSGGVSTPVPHDGLDPQRDAQGYRADPGDPVGTTQDEGLLLNAGVAAAYTNPDLGKLGASARILLEGRNALIGIFDTLGRGSSLSWQTILGQVSYDRSLSSFAQLTVRANVSNHRTDRKFLLSPAIRGDDPTTNPSTYCSQSLPLGGCADGHVFPDGLQELQRYATVQFGGEAFISLQLAQSNSLQAGVRAARTVVYGHSFQTNFDLDMASVVATAEEGGPWPTLGGSDIWGRTTAQLWAQDSWSLLPQLTVLTGLSAGLTTLPDAAAVAMGETGLSLAPEIGPRVAVLFTPVPPLALSASYARGVRSPTIAELSASLPHVSPYLGRFVGNPLLQPSNLDTVEVSAEWLHAQGDARVRLRATGFFENFSSPIVALDTSGDLVPLSNRLGVRVFGLEGEARLDTGSRTSAWANTSWFRAIDVATPPAFQLLTEIPQARLNAGVSLPIWDVLNLDLLIQVGSERRSGARGGLEILRRWRIPAYSSVAAQLRTEVLADRFTAALTVRNALDEEQIDDAPRMDRVPGGVPRGGRTIYGSISASY
jgi:outer membrane receptor protein involved in Fe transport